MSECYEGDSNEKELYNFLCACVEEGLISPKYAIDEDTGDEVTLPAKLPMKWQICNCCQGNGTHALHGMAIDSETWNYSWSYEEQEDYLSGRYDTACGECNTSGKVRVIDWDCVDPEIKKYWDEYQQSIWEMEMEMAAERRMGA